MTGKKSWREVCQKMRPSFTSSLIQTWKILQGKGFGYIHDSAWIEHSNHGMCIPIAGIVK